ncbi:hypothetical protein Mapa_013629 [Marchantia paleacea]|nr:hypothetical protein Mapa_013629 [Marchantia paleacea]
MGAPNKLKLGRSSSLIHSQNLKYRIGFRHIFQQKALMNHLVMNGAYYLQHNVFTEYNITNHLKGVEVQYAGNRLEALQKVSNLEKRNAKLALLSIEYKASG